MSAHYASMRMPKSTVTVYYRRRLRRSVRRLLGWSRLRLSAALDSRRDTKLESRPGAILDGQEAVLIRREGRICLF